MDWAAFTTAFFGFMRVSESTAANDSFNERTLSGKDVRYKEDTEHHRCPRQTHFITAAMFYHYVIVININHVQCGANVTPTQRNGFYIKESISTELKEEFMRYI